jgi:small subunit ribosomal protein S1
MDFKKGDEVETVILAIDAERERISLGLKQVEGDPFTSFVAEHGKGAAVKGIVESVDTKGAVIKLGELVTGYLRVSEISQDRIEDARSVLNEGDEIETKITSIDRKSRRISLSVKALEAEAESEAVREYSAKATGGMSSLGDKLKEQLSKK